MTDQVEKVVIVGSGPAGLTAAIYAARGSLNPLVISGREAGGQLMLTTDVDDYPGFPEGIQGPELMEKFRAQATRFGTRFINEDVISVDLSQKPFTVQTESHKLYAISLIIATGASAKWLEIPTEKKFIGRGISSCAVCDGFFYKGKDVIVVGGGDTAMREAQHLAKVCSSVLIVHRRDQLRAQDALVNLVKSKDNVKFQLSSVIEEILGGDKVERVKLKDVGTGEIREINIDGIFIAIGHNPNVKFLGDQVELGDNGYIKVFDETKTSVDGVFVAGDVSDYRYRQASTASGAGTKAALDVEEYLEKIH